MKKFLILTLTMLSFAAVITGCSQTPKLSEEEIEKVNAAFDPKNKDGKYLIVSHVKSK